MTIEILRNKQWASWADGAYLHEGEDGAVSVSKCHRGGNWLYLIHMKICSVTLTMVSHQSCCKGHISTDGGLSFKEELKYLTQLPFQGFCGQMIKKKMWLILKKWPKRLWALAHAVWTWYCREILPIKLESTCGTSVNEIVSRHKWLKPTHASVVCWIEFALCPLAAPSVAGIQVKDSSGAMRQ